MSLFTPGGKRRLPPRRGVARRARAALALLGEEVADEAGEAFLLRFCPLGQVGGQKDVIALIAFGAWARLFALR
jgi:hypothetical protein